MGPAWSEHITHWQLLVDALSRSLRHTHTLTHVRTHVHSQTHKGSHMHRVLPETTYRDPFHLPLLTTVISCGLIGPHQTTSHTSSVFLPLARSLPRTPSLARPPVPFLHAASPAPPTPFSCLPFISFHLSSLLNSTTGIRV